MRRLHPAFFTVLFVGLLSPAPRPAAAQMSGHGHAPSVAEDARLIMVHDSDAREIVLTIGPIRLPADAHVMQLTPAEQIEIPVDGWLTAFEARVVDADGQALPSSLLHHINLVMPERRELFMPIMQRLAAAGQETGRIQLPWPLGIPVSAGEPVITVAMVHNPTAQPVDLRIEARLSYRTAGRTNRVSVQPFFMDIQPPPDEASFDLPPGRSELTWEGSPAVDARILGVGGHIHRYGTELRLEEVGDDGSVRVLWRTEPELSDDGDVADVPRKTFLLRFGIPLRAGRTYRLHALYDNPTPDTIRAGGMAEIGGAVLPRGEWPDADPGESLYLADYRQFTRFNPELHGRFGGAEREAAANAAPEAGEAGEADHHQHGPTERPSIRDP